MELLLTRDYKKKGYTIGKMYINGEFFSDSCEDEDRGLNNNMTLSTISKLKVYGETAIPTGRYQVVWSYSNRFKKYLPEIKNVKGFSGIRIHSGNTAKDSLGCVLLGENKIKGGLINPRPICDKFNKIIETTVKKEDIFITIR